MTIRFTAITVGALLAAAKLAPRPKPDTDLEAIDSLLHRNAEAHLDSPSGAVINVATVLADRIAELTKQAAPSVPPTETSTEAGSGLPAVTSDKPPVTSETVSVETPIAEPEALVDPVPAAEVAAEPEAVDADATKPNQSKPKR
jgi:hypothetical protein